MGMDRFASIGAFVTVVDAGSFVRAAERLHTSTSTLSRQVADLEQHLGARLLNRTTRTLSLTENGRAFYERAIDLLADLEEVESTATLAATIPRGTLRLTCSYALGVQRLAPAMASFAARHPQVRFDVSVSDRIVDLVEEGLDLAIRVGMLGSEQLVARKLGIMRMLIGASPEYLKAHGTPQRPTDLAKHTALTYAYSPNPLLWRMTDRQGRRHEVRVTGPLHSNSGDMTIAAAIAGMGLVFEPDFSIQPVFDAGLLVRVLPGYDNTPYDIWAVYPSRRHLSAKVRLFVDHVEQQFKATGVRR